MPFIQAVYVEKCFLNGNLIPNNANQCSRPDLVIFNTLNSEVIVADIKTGKAKYKNKQKNKNEQNIGTFTPPKVTRNNSFTHIEVKP